MDVTIIGTGNMARGIGSRVLAGGHDLSVVGEDSERGGAVAADIGGAGTVKTAVAGDPIEGEVVVLAVYYPDARVAAEQYADQLAGKVVVDITNPVNESFDGLVVPPDGSATEELAALASGTRWVKAFNTTFAAPLTSGQVAGHKLDVLIAGDDEDRQGQGRRTRPRRRAQPDRRRPAEARARTRARRPASHRGPERARDGFHKRPQHCRLTDQTAEVAMHYHYDVIVIGGGSPGEHCAGALAEGGLGVALVEGELVAGECSYWSWIRPKTRLRRDEAVHGAREAAASGEVDVEAALAWRDFMVSEYSDTGQERCWPGRPSSCLRGGGRLAGPGVVEVDGVRHTAEHVVLACGVDPIIPPIPGVGGPIVPALTAALPALAAIWRSSWRRCGSSSSPPASSTRRCRQRCSAISSTSGGDQLRVTLPLGRVVGPADVAALAVHLMTNTALTGATYIDGGQQLV